MDAGLRVTLPRDAIGDLVAVSEQYVHAVARGYEDLGVVAGVGDLDAAEDVGLQRLRAAAGAAEHPMPDVRPGAGPWVVSLVACPLDSPTTVGRDADGRIVAEVLTPGLFGIKGDISRRSIPLRWAHSDADADHLGSLVDCEERGGVLLVTAVLADTAKGREVAALVAAGAVRAASVGFYPLESREEFHTAAGVRVQRRVRAELRELSIVRRGAYPAARVVSLAPGDAEEARKAGCRRRVEAATGVDAHTVRAWSQEATERRQGHEAMIRRWREGSPKMRADLERIMPPGLLAEARS